MRCNEARRLLTEGAIVTSDLTGHLKGCRSCREIAEATRGVEALLADARGDIAVPELAQVRTKVECTATSQSRWENIMSRLADRTEQHRRLLAGMGFALVVFVVVTLVPFSYTAVTGYQISLTDRTDQDFSPQLLTTAMAAVGHKDVTVSQGAQPGQYIFAGLSNRQEASDIAAALAALTGSGTAPVVEPVLGKMSGTIYAQAVRKIASDEDGPIRIRLENGRFLVNGRTLEESLLSAGTDEDEIENVVRRYLNDQGAFTGDLIISAEVDVINADRVIRLKEIREDGSDVRMRMIPGEVAIRYRVDDSGRESEERVQVISGEELDSLANEYGRGIILEVPDGGEVGDSTVLIRLQVVPRE